MQPDVQASVLQVINTLATCNWNRQRTLELINYHTTYAIN